MVLPAPSRRARPPPCRPSSPAGVVHRHRGFDQLHRRAGVLAVRTMARVSLGEAGAAVAGTGVQELAADPVVEADARATCCTSAPMASQRSATS